MSSSVRWSRYIKVRDQLTCMMCGVKPGAGRLESHHIYPKSLYPAKELELSNGICLCLKCHRGVVHSENTFNDGGNWKKFVLMFRWLVSLKSARQFNQENQQKISQSNQEPLS